MYCFVFLLLATAVSIWRDSMMATPTIATFWCAINTLSLGTFIVVALLEDRYRRRLAAGKIFEHHDGDSRDGGPTLLEETLDATTIADAREARVELVHSLPNTKD